MNHHGILIGAVVFLCIGLFHPLVIKGEYYFGRKIAWAFLVCGILALVSSALVSHDFWSILLGVIGFSSLWSIHEVFQQHRRVEKGWFPKNPKRASDYR